MSGHQNGHHDWVFSMVRAAHVTETTEATFRAVMDEIASPRWKGAVDAVRLAYAKGGKDAASEPKKKLPAILFSGTFSKRSASALTLASGLICVDLDELGDRVEAMRELIASDPHTLGAFVSPTGTGLKVIFRIDPAKPHLESFKAAERFVLEQWGLEVDQACKDVSRMCFVSHDPDCFTAEDAEVLPYPPPTPIEFKPSGLHATTIGELTPGDDYDRRGDFTELLSRHGWTKLGEHGWTRPGKTTGLSATFGKVPGRFYVFTSSTEFEANHVYRPWHVYAILECGGDFTRAAKELGEKGYGEQKPRKKRTLEDEEGVGPVPTLVGKPLSDFNLPPKGDSSILIGNRWLSRGDLAILASTSGMGKSSLSIQAAVTWGLGLPLFDGFHPNGPLKSLIFQSEDSEGDVAEVRLSLEHAMKLTDEQKAQIRQNVIIVTDRIHRGLSFRAELQRQLEIHKPDLVWINPLLAFIGGDVNDSTDVGLFIREQLNSLNEPARFAYVIVHHTAKPPKEKQARQWNEVMYEMAGSADLTNAARAILALQASDKEGDFKLIGAKRGARAGLTKLVPGKVESNIKWPTATSIIGLRHSTERMLVDGQDLRVIHWSRYELEMDADAPKSKGGRPPKYSLADFMPRIPIGPEAALPAGAIWKRAKLETGISESGLKDLLFRAAKEGAVCKTDKPGIGPVYYAP